MLDGYATRAETARGRTESVRSQPVRVVGQQQAGSGSDVFEAALGVQDDPGTRVRDALSVAVLIALDRSQGAPPADQTHCLRRARTLTPMGTCTHQGKGRQAT
jgi:hypothetical protein